MTTRAPGDPAADPQVETPLAMGAICFRDRPFDQILAAASASAFPGIGLTVGQCLSALERGISWDDLPSRIAGAGLRLAEFELVRLCEDGPVAAANRLVEELALALRPDRVHVAAFRGEAARIADEFAAVCERLAPVPVAVEFMPYSAVSSLDQARELVGTVAAPNAGIVLDVLHFFRSGGRIEQLDRDLLEAVVCIQLSDVVRRPGVRPIDEARHLRTYPGRGSLDIAGFLRAVREATDVVPPVSVEPVSDALESLPLGVVAEETMFSTLDVLDAAGWPR
ncbi:sugar phosphate isomerase/epimerase family protein [Pseudonocardia lutea]|uniref:Sugar phosphate isomerase/epimerase family protein n=1 Tax=Pseudonocardia lutea TaxID=2172015 RepID=A0ABW1I3U9_9PSEU